MVADISGIPRYRAALLITRMAVRGRYDAGWMCRYESRGDDSRKPVRDFSRPSGEYGPTIATDRWGLKAPDFATLSGRGSLLL